MSTDWIERYAMDNWNQQDVYKFNFSQVAMKKGENKKKVVTLDTYILYTRGQMQFNSI